MSSNLEARTEKAARLLAGARQAVALTGAGVSTPSGIPDFRSPGSGLWEEHGPMEVASLSAFRRQPECFFDWIYPLAETLRSARPNPAHRALASMEEAGYLRAVITQNIDGLHQQAGSKTVIELHGGLRTATCIECGTRAPLDDRFDGLVSSGEVPRCPLCEGVLKPDVTLFGEGLPADVIEAAMGHAERADLMLVVGTSLEVVPASRLPLLTYERGGRLLVVNLSPTQVDEIADVVIREDVAVALPQIARSCVRGSRK